jgi:hypothetical protein
MSSQQDRKPDDPEELRHRQERAARKARIAERVLSALGHSNDCRTVQVRPLWAYNYRVNVLVGADAVSATIAHSYFVETDLEGNIIQSTPRIKVQAGST